MKSYGVKVLWLICISVRFWWKATNSQSKYKTAFLGKDPRFRESLCADNTVRIRYTNRPVLFHCHFQILRRGSSYRLKPRGSCYTHDIFSYPYFNGQCASIYYVCSSCHCYFIAWPLFLPSIFLLTVGLYGISSIRRRAFLSRSCQYPTILEKQVALHSWQAQPWRIWGFITCVRRASPCQRL